MNTPLPCLLVTCLAVTVGGLLHASAADLPPSGTNSIHGLVRFVNADAEILALLGPPGNEGMTSLIAIANTEPPDSLGATKYFATSDPLSQVYDLTVSVNDLPLIYVVQAAMSLDGSFEEYYTAPQAATPLTSNSPPATVDFDECVALVELRYEDSLGQPVAALDGRALVSEVATGVWRARYLNQPAGRTGNFLVVPTGVEIQLSIEVDTGADIYLDRLTHRETHILTLACNDKPVITLTIPDAGTLGRIVGNANVVGEIEVSTEGYVELLGRPVIKARGPSGNQRYAALDADLPGSDGSRSFKLEGLVPSVPGEGWQVQAEMQFGEDERFEYFITPALGFGLFNPAVEILAGADTDLGDTFVMTPARLVGRLTLSGPPEFAGQTSALRGLVRASDFDDDMDGIPDYIGATGINGSYVIASGVDELAPGATLTTAGGQATASFAGAFNPATAAFEGDYEAVVGMLNDEPGVWKYDGLSLVFDTSGVAGSPYVNELLYVFEHEPWQGTLAPGERATNDVYYGFAEVCLRIRSPTPFFYPRVINSYGYYTNYGANGNILNSYTALLGNASAPPYAVDAATNEAVVTFYVPQGRYTLLPAISIVDPDGGVSETQLPAVEIVVTAGESYCVEECIRVFIEPPTCTTNFGFLGWGNAVSLCGQTLTNISVTIRPLSDPSIRLGYSERWLSAYATNEMRMPGQVFPEFDGYDPALYHDMVWTVVAKDNLGHVATRQMTFHYDFTGPVLNCTDITVTSANGIDAVVDYNLTTSSDGILVCEPPSGSTFPIGITPVTCIARDLCRNTNTCTFNVTVGPRSTDCVLNLAVAQADPPAIALTWDCDGILQWAPDVTGPWSDLPEAASPHTTPLGEAQRFYRIRLPGSPPE